MSSPKYEGVVYCRFQYIYLSRTDSIISNVLSNQNQSKFGVSIEGSSFPGNLVEWALVCNDIKWNSY